MILTDDALVELLTYSGYVADYSDGVGTICGVTIEILARRITILMDNSFIQVIDFNCSSKSIFESEHKQQCM